ncbi:MAG: hypothetical protein PVI69_13395 [Desulfobacterales bacterium]|jgi:hypothetical protein
MKVPGTDFSLSGGALVGGLALTFAAPIVLPLVANVLKCIVKTGMKAGMIAYGKGREFVGDTQESLVKITKEAKSEADAELKAKR